MSGDATIPRLGLGTWQNTDVDQCRDSVRAALDVGYRHVDSAELYDNEAPVGIGIEAASVDRGAVFLATKILHPRRVEDDPTPGSIRHAVEGCLSRLGVDAVDLMYVHWPHDYDLEMVHSTLAELRDDGLIDAVGVSNYEPDHVDTALETDPAIVANQVELHPFFPQPDLRKYCDDVDVDVVAYAPLAHGEVFDDPELADLAADHETSIAQVTLAWHRAKGVAAVPKATSEAHIRDNWQSRSLEPSAADVARVDAIEREERFFDPAYAPDW